MQSTRHFRSANKAGVASVACRDRVLMRFGTHAKPLPTDRAGTVVQATSASKDRGSPV